MPLPNPLESTVENYFVKQVMKAVPEAEIRKYKTRRNDPDRLCLFPVGKAIFVELKRPGEKPRPGQIREMNRLMALGFDVWVIESKPEVDIFVKWLKKICGVSE